MSPSRSTTVKSFRVHYTDPNGIEGATCLLAESDARVTAETLTRYGFTDLTVRLDVIGKVGKGRCDGRCTGSTSRYCHCQCGGANHGSAHQWKVPA